MEKAKHYLYSSASNYACGKELIELEIAENPVTDVLGKNEFWKYNNYEE
ncbi:hypothetical protein [Kaistella daneshvariae]|nr:hypothetical protein [Kaistella daneshvariae]